MKLSIQDELFARNLGWKVLEYLKLEHPEYAIQEIESDALQVLQKIQTILDDDQLDDPECYRRIELIVKTFHTNGLSTERHNW